MKVLVIGTSLSGKTTLVKLLRAKNLLNISEIDEELTKLNNGAFPSNEELKKTLSLKVIESILQKQDVIFFTNTDYFSEEDLTKAKDLGFKIIQISVSLNKLVRRNNLRVKNEGYYDMREWLPGMVNYQNNIKDKNLVDAVINGEQDEEQVLEDLRNSLK